VAARIQIEIREVRGPWLDVFEQPREEGDVMGVVSLHSGPRLAVPAHAAKPEMFTSVWEFPSEPEEGAGRVKLVRIELEMFPKNFEGINRAKRGRWFKLVVDKSGIGFFEVEGVAVVSDGNVASAEELMQLFDQWPVILEILLVPFKVGEGPDRGHFLVCPTIGK